MPQEDECGSLYLLVAVMRRVLKAVGAAVVQRFHFDAAAAQVAVRAGEAVLQQPVEVVAGVALHSAQQDG